MAERQPIGPNDTISAKGRNLVYDSDGSRFLFQGVAFPTTARSGLYDEAGWIAVLDQLAETTNINTVRIYRMDCTKGDQYSGFLKHAAELGIYVMIPLTSPTGSGVLDRLKPAPKCYPRRLFEYGKTCVNQFSKHPNVVAGFIGNEVMNTVDSWLAAPCVKAYTRDLKRYMLLDDAHNLRSLPLVYAAQHDSLTAQISAHESMKLTLDYLSCQSDSHDDDDLTIDIFGINIESWCSSLQTFRYNEDGTESAYYLLWRALSNNTTTTTALMFSEMGCAKDLFNRDNGLQPQGVRDWAQVPVVLKDMADSFSGFCAYTYYGNPAFGMMDPHQGWDGHSVLAPSPDFENFQQQLRAVVNTTTIPTTTDKVLLSSLPENNTKRPSCQSVIKRLQATCPDCNLRLVPVERMPSHYHHAHTGRVGLVVAAFVLSIIVCASLRRFQKKYGRPRNEWSGQTTYQSISSSPETQ